MAPGAKRIAASLIVALSLCAGPTAHAQTAWAPGFAFGSPGGELGLTALVGGTLLLGLLPLSDTGWKPAASRERDDSYGFASDLTGGWGGFLLQLPVSFASEAGYYDGREVPDAYALALRTTLIDIQAVGLGSGIGALLKQTTGRCRPRDYDGYLCGFGRDGFPSGHTITPSAVAGVHLTLALATRDDPSPRFVAFSIAEAAAVATAILRVAAGAHSWEDVLVGGLLGHAAGVAIALLHPMELVAPPAGLAAKGLPYGTLGWGGVF